MSAVGTLVFCLDCGNLLDRTTGSPTIRCDLCGKTNKDTSLKTVTTESGPNAFPSALRLKHSVVQTVTASDMAMEAEINQSCPECGNPKMKFSTRQLRGADEGATVFYRCEKCGHRFNTNN